MRQVLINKRAFTLAEVLITLGIIGVVAAMTIPTVLSNVQDQQAKTAWKKAYSTMSQATEMMAADNGGSIVGTFTSEPTLRDAYMKYLRKAKTCDSSTTEGCMAPDVKGLNGTTNALGAGAAIVLNDGSVVQVWVSSPECIMSIGTPEVFKRCGGGIVDTNGLKKPNVIGKDMFEFHILKDRILPYGTQGDAFSGDCVPTGMGESCGALYLYQ